MMLEPDKLQLARRLLSFWAPGIPAFAFGSRVHGRHLKPTSDLDICLKADAPVDPIVLTDLRDAFSSSRLPFRADIVDWSTISDEFRNAIVADLEPFQPM